MVSKLLLVVNILLMFLYHQMQDIKINISMSLYDYQYNIYKEYSISNLIASGAGSLGGGHVGEVEKADPITALDQAFSRQLKQRKI